MLNNREHAVHLLTAIDRIREDGTVVTSREKGYWLDLLEYRDDQTCRCNPGRRELEAKTGHGHRTLQEMDNRAAELEIYVIDGFCDERGRLRNRYIWNPYFLGFDNDGQPTRVLANNPLTDAENSTERKSPAKSANRGQMTSKMTTIPDRKDLLRQEEKHALRGQPTTVSDAQDRSAKSRQTGDTLPRRKSRVQQWELIVAVAELERQLGTEPPESVLPRYTLRKQINDLKQQLDELSGAGRHRFVLTDPSTVM